MKEWTQRLFELVAVKSSRSPGKEPTNQNDGGVFSARRQDFQAYKRHWPQWHILFNWATTYTESWLPNPAPPRPASVNPTKAKKELTHNAINASPAWKPYLCPVSLEIKSPTAVPINWTSVEAVFRNVSRFSRKQECRITLAALVVLETSYQDSTTRISEHLLTPQLLNGEI